MPVAREPVTAWIGLGGNLGDVAQALREAVQAIDDLPGTRVTARSSLYRTAPCEASGPDYINAVIGIFTTLSAPELLEALQKIEISAGRERPYFHAPRTLDLDLLLYGSARISSPALTVPHPRMGGRAFVLVPLAEVAPDQVSAEQLRSVSGQKIALLECF